MAPKRPYELVYDTDVAEHVKAIDRKYYSLIERTIKEQLGYEPEVETENRKPLNRPAVFGTAWELRFGPQNCFRVFYRTDVAARQVYILAVGVKVGNRLSVGRRRFQL